jgi:hypothetical protein
MNDLVTTLFVLRLVKLILEIALLALVGQGIVWIMIRAVGQSASENLFYRVLQIIASPFTKLVRLVTPRFVDDRHVPWAVFGLLLVGYIWILFTIANTCINAGLTVVECQAVR